MIEQHKALQTRLQAMFPFYTWEGVVHLPLEPRETRLGESREFQKFCDKNRADLVYYYRQLLKRIPRDHLELMLLDFQAFAGFLFSTWVSNGKNVLSGVEI